jgi:quercetin dioxygenase-like cupin family protein
MMMTPAIPMDQFISVIDGEGLAIIAGREIELCRGVAVHVPPQATHVFRAKSR